MQFPADVLLVRLVSSLTHESSVYLIIGWQQLQYLKTLVLPFEQGSEYYVNY